MRGPANFSQWFDASCACSGRSTACCSICSRRSLARTTWIGGSAGARSIPTEVEHVPHTSNAIGVTLYFGDQLVCSIYGKHDQNCANGADNPAREIHWQAHVWTNMSEAERCWKCNAPGGWSSMLCETQGNVAASGTRSGPMTRSYFVALAFIRTEDGLVPGDCRMSERGGCDVASRSSEAHDRQCRRGRL